MKFNCIIPPHAHPELMLLGSGKAILCLAPFVLENEAQRQFIVEAKKNGYYIIIDNGAAEEQQVSLKKLIEAAILVQADEVVVPDVLLNGEATLNQLNEFAPHLRQALPDAKLMGVPQGKALDEWLACYTKMVESDLVDVIGISKISVPVAWAGRSGSSDIMASRKQCVEYLNNNKLLVKPIHLLGMGDPREFWLYRHYHNVRSTDSCYSILAAIAGLTLRTDEFVRKPTTNDYFDHKLTTEELIRAIDNIKWTNENVQVWK